MSLFIDPRGQPTFGIGLCARCSRKFPLAELYSDPNSPGLKVCIEDLDEFDPYRLPPREPDQIVLPFTRPDVPLTGFSDTTAVRTYEIITEDEDPITSETGDVLVTEEYA